MNDYKRINNWWCLLVAIGLMIVTSFGTISIAPSFDWQFLIIVVIYVVVSNICNYYICLLIVNANGKVQNAKRIKHQCYSMLDEKDKWEDFFLYDLYTNIIYNCVNSYNVYSNGVYNKRLRKRIDEKVIDFLTYRDYFLDKKLHVLLKNCCLSRKKKRIIYKLQKNQEDTSYSNYIY